MQDFKKYIDHLIVSDPDAHFGGRKIFYNQTLTVNDFCSVEYTLEQAGYRPNKMMALMRAYWNPEVAAKAKHEMRFFETKDHYSIGFHNYGIEKPRGQKGFCMQAMTILREPSGRIRLSVFYRTVEILKKFYADMVFVQDQVLPYFNIKPSIVTFYFTSVTLNTLYMPQLINLMKDPDKTIKMIEQSDPKFYRMMCRVSSVLLDPVPNKFMQLERGKIGINDYNRPYLERLSEQWKKMKGLKK